jgi:geranylgeranyl pyrophosphate synthase
MSIDRKLMSIKRTFRRHGGQAMDNVRKGISLDYKDNSCLSQALGYFSEVTLSGALPVFPALISMSCEAVGGKAKDTTAFGEAMVLITAAADLHDDLIDASLVKGGKQTVLGKFGSTITILAGDVLLAEGLSRLHEAGSHISKDKSTEIVRLVSDAVYEICRAEALESRIRTNPDVPPQEYQEVIRLKSVVPMIAMKIGGILGNGDPKVVEMLGGFGRSYGIVSATVEEFADLLEIDELRNRLKNECLPLPMIYALQNIEIRKTLDPLLKSRELSRTTHKRIIDIVLASKEVAALQESLILAGKEAVKSLPYVVKEIREELKNALLVPLSYFE